MARALSRHCLDLRLAEGLPRGYRSFGGLPELVAMRRPLLALFFVAVFAAPARAGAETVPPQRVAVEIVQSFAADRRLRAGAVETGPFAISRLRLPLDRHAARLLAAAGAVPAARPDKADARLVIRLSGIARGQLYDSMERLARKRRLRYAAAQVSGEIAFSTADGRLVCRSAFDGEAGETAGIPVVANRDLRESPLFAPFEAALAASGSFLDALAAVIGRVLGGPAPATRSAKVACWESP